MMEDHVCSKTRRLAVAAGGIEPPRAREMFTTLSTLPVIRGHHFAHILKGVLPSAGCRTRTGGAYVPANLQPVEKLSHPIFD